MVIALLEAWNGLSPFLRLLTAKPRSRFYYKVYCNPDRSYLCMPLWLEGGFKPSAYTLCKYKTAISEITKGGEIFVLSSD